MLTTSLTPPTTPRTVQRSIWIVLACAAISAPLAAQEQPPDTDPDDAAEQVAEDAQPRVVDPLPPGMRIEQMLEPPQIDPQLQFQLRMLQQARQQRITFDPQIPTEAQLEQIIIEPHIRRLVDQLNDSAFAVREAAAETLAAGPDEKDQLYAVLHRESLTPEQRHRIISIINDMLQRPAGALGIEMGVLPDARGQGVVRVSGLVPGMPAEQVIRVNDFITHIEGEPIHSTRDLALIVQRREPGVPITMLVQRERWENGQPVKDELNRTIRDTLEVSLVLGSTDELAAAPNSRVARRDHSAEIDLAVKRFGPPAQQLAVAGNPETLPFFTRQPGAMTPEWLDQSREIRFLVQQLRLLRDNDAPPDDYMRAGWAQKLEELRERAVDPTITPQEREIHRRIAERYEQLLPE